MIPLRDNIASKSRPVVNWSIIAANCYFFYLELKIQSPRQLENFVRKWSLIPLHILRDPLLHWKSLFTATFLHGGWTHIVGNMLFLYVFGHSVEDRMGHFRYLFFYLGIGALANVTQAIISPHSTIPLLGASGAIAGVLGSYFFYYPYAKILTLIPFGIFSRIVEIPAFIFLGFWFVLQTLNGTLSLSVEMRTHEAMGGIAWWAHASGFIGGLLLSPALARQKGKQR